MTALALGSKCGVLGVRSQAAGARSPPTARSRVNSEASAAPCTPVAKRDRKSRRASFSIDIGELRGNKNGLAEIGESPPASFRQARRFTFLVVQVCRPVAGKPVD